ncbi:hypothetical protein STXM2123_1015 [Streptomyces sp. F-3]|nr:hypothetical protein STXM2123_1015 [Streptomyces sp. F-3]
MRCYRLGGGSGVRLAHDPQSSIDRLCPRLRLSEMKNPLAQEGTPRRCRPPVDPAAETDQRGSPSRRHTARMGSGYRSRRALRDERPRSGNGTPALRGDDGSPLVRVPKTWTRFKGYPAHRNLSGQPDPREPP